MKLVFQIAAGIVLGWLVITALKLSAASAAFKSLSAQVETAQPAAKPRPSTAELDRQISRDFARAESAARAHDEAHPTAPTPQLKWEGAPPPGGKDLN